MVLCLLFKTTTSKLKFKNIINKHKKGIRNKKKEIMNRIQKNNYLTDSIDTELIDLWSKLDHQPNVIVCKYYSKIYKYYTISYF